MARNLVSGDVPTPDGPRQAYAFDHEQGGRPSSVLAAVCGPVAATYLPGRRVAGIKLGDDLVEVHVVVANGTPIRADGQQVNTSLRPGHLVRPAARQLARGAQ